MKSASRLARLAPRPTLPLGRTAPRVFRIRSPHINRCQSTFSFSSNLTGTRHGRTGPAELRVPAFTLSPPTSLYCPSSPPSQSRPAPAPHARRPLVAPTDCPSSASAPACLGGPTRDRGPGRPGPDRTARRSHGFMLRARAPPTRDAAPFPMPIAHAGGRGGGGGVTVGG